MRVKGERHGRGEWIRKKSGYPASNRIKLTRTFELPLLGNINDNNVLSPAKYCILNNILQCQSRSIRFISSTRSSSRNPISHKSFECHVRFSVLKNY